jgi:hypothetical protein
MLKDHGYAADVPSQPEGPQPTARRDDAQDAENLPGKSEPPDQVQPDKAEHTKRRRTAGAVIVAVIESVIDSWP